MPIHSCLARQRSTLMQSMCFLAAAALAITLAAPASGTNEPANEAQRPTKALTLERVFASPSLDGPAPRKVKLSPDGRWITVLKNRPEDRERYDLWGYDRQGGQWSMLVDSSKFESGRELSEAEKMQRERQRIGDLKGIVAYDWADDSRSILVPLARRPVPRRARRHSHAADGHRRGRTEPRALPKGRLRVLRARRRLWTGTAGAQAQPVTPAEASDTVHWGEAEFVAQEEMARITGFWWSPDDARIAVERFDEAPVGVVTRAAIGAEDTRTFEQRYPAAGTANAVVQLFVMNPDGSGRVKSISAPTRTSTLRASTGHPMAGRSTSSGRTAPRPGSTCSRSIPPPASPACCSRKARAARWINLTDNYRFLKDGSLIWWSERDGYGHLYHYAAASGGS